MSGVEGGVRKRLEEVVASRHSWPSLALHWGGKQTISNFSSRGRGLFTCLCCLFEPCIVVDVWLLGSDARDWEGLPVGLLATDSLQNVPIGRGWQSVNARGVTVQGMVNMMSVCIIITRVFMYRPCLKEQVTQLFNVVYVVMYKTGCTICQRYTRCSAGSNGRQIAFTHLLRPQVSIVISTHI